MKHVNQNELMTFYNILYLSIQARHAWKYKVDTDQMLHNVAYNQGLYCLQLIQQVFRN